MSSRIRLPRRGISIATGGLAWLRVWEALPSLFLHHTDYAHPGYKGSMISALEIYAVITKASPIGLRPARTKCGDEPCATVTEEELRVFETAAWAEAQATGLGSRP